MRAVKKDSLLAMAEERQTQGSKDECGQDSSGRRLFLIRDEEEKHKKNRSCGTQENRRGAAGKQENPGRRNLE